jgi:hypothetical protein
MLAERSVPAGAAKMLWNGPWELRNGWGTPGRQPDMGEPGVAAAGMA